MGKAGAQIEISAGTSRLASGLTAAKRAFLTWGTATARGIGAAFKGVNKALAPGDTMKRAVGNLGGDLMGKGLSAISDAATEVRDFERNLVRFKITAGDAAPPIDSLRKTMIGISRETGVARDEVMAGAAAYVGFTGDAAGAADAASLFARVAQATGSSTADVAQAMSALKSSMGITAKEGEAAFSALIVQGKGGAVEIKDMAGELAGLAPQFALFKNGKGVQGLREMGAGFQVVMKNAASASDAATKYQALMGSLSDKETLKKLKGLGVQVTDNKGKLLDASTVFGNIAKNQKLFKGTNLSTVFGRKEAQLAALALKEHIGLYRELRDQAQDTGAVQRDLGTFLESDAGRLDKAFNNMKLAVAEAFTPERIKAFTTAIEGLAEKLGPVIDFIGKAADKLGSLVSVGKKIRGALGGESLSPGRNWANVAEDKMIVQQGAMYGHSEAKIAGAKSRLADDAARQQAIKSILGNEKDERTTPDSIRAAVLAANNTRGYGAGKIGEQMAGEQYLRNAGVSNEERAKIEAEINANKAANEVQTIAIARAIQEGFDRIGVQNPVVHLGDNQVSRSVDNSTNARRGTK